MPDIEEQSGLAGLSGAPLFNGEFRHSLDDKRRLTIPSYWREMVGQPRVLFVAKASSGPYLKVLPAKVASARISESLAKLTFEEREAQEQILGGRTGLFEWDAQGRVRLSEDMLKHAKIDAKVGLKGTMFGFQIWNQDDCPFDEKLATSPDAIKAAMRGIGL